jgi:hypothetical protein
MLNHLHRQAATTPMVRAAIQATLRQSPQHPAYGAFIRGHAGISSTSIPTQYRRDTDVMPKPRSFAKSAR